jgi:hypothetical protein
MVNANEINRTCILFNGALRYTCLACTMRLFEAKKLRFIQQMMIGDKKAAMFEPSCEPDQNFFNVVNGRHIKASKAELLVQ